MRGLIGLGVAIFLSGWIYPALGHTTGGAIIAILIGGEVGIAIGKGRG